MGITQITQGTTKVPYNKSKEYWRQYNQKRLAYIVAKNRERRILLKSNKPPKTLSIQIGGGKTLKYTI